LASHGTRRRYATTAWPSASTSAVPSGSCRHPPVRWGGGC
jgi:hypothetical protein